ncbi:hypothetical protein H2202_003829 [Exophiala xenobiotica]|nr:hypothetical protein H2202_003829 [Exophiala xenobiotica]
MADFAASAAVNVVYHIYTAKERLDKLEDIIDGLPNFRGTISGLEELLNDIDQVYVRALTLASINGGSLHRQLDRQSHHGDLPPVLLAVRTIRQAMQVILAGIRIKSYVANNNVGWAHLAWSSLDATQVQNKLDRQGADDFKRGRNL